MAEDSFSRYLLLPELRLLETRALGKDGLGGTELLAEKVSPMEVCPRCAKRRARAFTTDVGCG